MLSILLSIIYISFISLGLPDSLLGSAWPPCTGSFKFLCPTPVLPFFLMLLAVLTTVLVERVNRI